MDTRRPPLEAVGLKRSFWENKRVLLTGHTGFKGAWLALMLELVGARVSGLALAPHTDPSLFELLRPWPILRSTIGDVRDKAAIDRVISESQPQIVIHMAASATVRAAYQDPDNAFSTNVLGTVRLLDGLRSASSPPSAILITTTDKVYDVGGPDRPYVETDRLGGSDPYSASKVGQEIVAATYRAHYFDANLTRIATARAGNVIGGGDWARYRLVPDYVRASQSGQGLVLRNPDAVRPWQHVLDALSGYLLYIQALVEAPDVPASLNFAPRTNQSCTVTELLQILDEGQPKWTQNHTATWSEESKLRLDSGLAAKTIGWTSILQLDEAAHLTSLWYREHASGADPRLLTIEQIEAFLDAM